MRIARSTIVSANWTTLLRELVVTFIGVLMALAVSALWSERQDRAKEHTALTQLLATTRENERIIAQAIFEDSSTMVIDGTLRRDFAAPTTTLPNDSVAVWLAWSAYMSTFEPLTGAYNALTQSGDINLIRDAALRSTIVTYTGQLDAKIQALRIFESVGVANFLSAFVDFPSPLRLWWAKPVGPAPSTGPLRRDARLEVLLTQRYTTAGNRVARLRRLRAQTVTLREALEKALKVSPVSPKPTHVIRNGMLAAS
ncbi:MAG: hypothetical protein ABJE10_00390 [bacterium]